MNSNKINIDKYTKELISKTDMENPGSDFKQKVMKRLLNDPSVEVHFVKKDNKNNNVWLVVSVLGMMLAYLFYLFINSGFSLKQGLVGIKTPSYIGILSDFFTRLWNELSFSPYILFALLGILLLVILDKLIVRYLYSI